MTFRHQDGLRFLSRALVFSLPPMVKEAMDINTFQAAVGPWTWLVLCCILCLCYVSLNPILNGTLIVLNVILNMSN